MGQICNILDTVEVCLIKFIPCHGSVPFSALPSPGILLFFSMLIHKIWFLACALRQWYSVCGLQTCCQQNRCRNWVNINVILSQMRNKQFEAQHMVWVVCLQMHWEEMGSVEKWWGSQANSWAKLLKINDRSMGVYYINYFTCVDVWIFP